MKLGGRAMLPPCSLKMKRMQLIKCSATTPGRPRVPAFSQAPNPHAHIHISYETAWEEPKIHFSLGGGEWTIQSMSKEVTSAGGSWAHLALPAQSTGDETLEFVITDGYGAWDKAEGDVNYRASGTGRYCLKDGILRPVTNPAVLIVSDLDDTLVGDDEATMAFTTWWREEGVPAGGRLVFNTGRGLDLFEELLEEKAECLPEPDMLISSVGTKIYKKTGSRWKEDEAYTARLGQNWSLEAAREAAYAALASVGKDSMHFRPPSEMNEHKVTCGVRADVVEDVLDHIGGSLQDAAVEHRLIISGKGDWKYLDLVPSRAGKLQALEYAREALGFKPEQTVACGDSGNDKDMLEGEHHAVVVGNAQPDLMAWAQGRAAAGAGAGGRKGKKRGPLVVQKSRAHGVLEGLQLLGFKE